MQIERTAVQKSQEVSALLENPNSRIFAGGTTFPQEAEEQIHLVDISALQGMDGIRQKGTRIEIGPLATLSSLSASSLLKTLAPALAEAAGSASEEIRTKGTLGGNLADARIGDTAVALLANGAKLTIKTGTDFRELLLDRFWSKNGKNDLQYDEWITRITLQTPKEMFWGSAFGKAGEWDRQEVPAAAAVWMSINERSIISSVRGALRTGAGRICRMFPLEKALKNQTADEGTFARAVSAMGGMVKEAAAGSELPELITTLLQRSLRMAEERRTL